MRRIRLRLLASFVAIALGVILLFGAIAYRIAVDSALRSEAAALGEVVSEMALVLSSSASRDTLPPLPYSRRARLFVLQDAQGAVRPSDRFDRLDPELLGAVEARRAEAAPGEPGYGTLELNGQHFVWASAWLGDGGERLTVAYPVQTDQSSVIRAIAGRLLITGAVVIWIAVWGALIITSILTRRLRQQHRQLVHQALHDSLTDLPNRTLLYDRLDQALHRAQQAGSSFALFVMDLDRFKEVNDTLGHHYGDQLLMEVGKRVSELLSETETVARLGGDEFAVLLPDCDLRHAIGAAKRILLRLEEPVVVNGVNLEARPSIGIALFPDHGNDAETLLQHADVAMYQAKRHRLGYCLYEEGRDPHSMRRLTMITELRSAVLEDQLVLHYQPKIDLRTGSTCGVEALVRWEHPILGLLTPEEFIELAEQTGLIGLVTDWVLTQAVGQCVAWREQGLELSVAVNLSAQNLQDARLPDKVARTLEAAGLPPDALELELTESDMMTDLARAMQVFEGLAALGVRLAIDDFGTGMSSLSYLKRLPVTELKIDKSFVIDMAEDENNAVIVRSIIDLAHNIGRRVVAEGVQDRDALQILEILGCDVAQGYFLSRPRNPRDLENWLRESAWGVRPMRERLSSIPGDR